MLVTDGVDVPQAAAVKKARIDGNAARDVELRTQVRLSLYQQGRRSRFFSRLYNRRRLLLTA